MHTPPRSKKSVVIEVIVRPPFFYSQQVPTFVVQHTRAVNDRTYAVGAATTLTTGTMQPTPWFGTLDLSDFGVSIGGDPHGVATVSYHTPTVSDGRTGSVAVARTALGLAHPGCLDRLERDGLDLG